MKGNLWAAFASSPTNITMDSASGLRIGRTIIWTLFTPESEQIQSINTQRQGYMAFLVSDRWRPNSGVLAAPEKGSVCQVGGRDIAFYISSHNSTQKRHITIKGNTSSSLGRYVNQIKNLGSRPWNCCFARRGLSPFIWVSHLHPLWDFLWTALAMTTTVRERY